MDVRVHKDNDKATYDDETALNQFLKGLKEKFKIQFNILKIQEGSILDHLGIHFVYDREGHINVSMIPFTQKLVKRYEEICTSTAPTAYTADTFKVG